MLVVGRWFFGIEVVECNVGVKKRDGVFDSRGVSDDGMGFKYLSKGWNFEESCEEEVPLEVGKCEELGGSRHGEPKTGNNPSLYSLDEYLKRFYCTLPVVGEETVSGRWSPM